MKNQVMYHPSGKIELVAKDAVFLPNVTEGFYKVKHVHIGMGTALEIHKDTEVSIPRGSRKLTEEYIDVPFLVHILPESGGLPSTKIFLFLVRQNPSIGLSKQVWD